MNDLVIFLCRCLTISLVIQVCLMLVFLWHLCSDKINLLADEELPKTAVILCLRGADPFLSDCLQALLHQNYPEYDLKLVVDRMEDPAWTIATDTVQQHGATNVQISPLRFIRKSCSLKCSSLIQAVTQLDDSYQAIAFVDADTIVHANWLRELVTPLADPNVGATTGNRWFVPTGSHWGSIVRYLWNVSAVVQMYLYGIPWGGTLAVKTEVLHQTRLLDKWGQAFCEDTMMRRILGKHKMQIKFVPSLIMLNQEECNLSGLKSWMQRQLIFSRLYHPHWLTLVGNAIFTILCPTFLSVLFVAALLTGQWYAAAISLSYYSSYVVALLLIVLFLEQRVQLVMRSDHQPTPQLSVAIICQMLMGIPLTQWVYGFVFLSSLWISKVKWRGITYKFKSPWKIRLVEYRPYQSLDQPAAPNISLN
ncbi:MULTISPECIES: glycosyltransferase family 2 protein [unclassified Nodularia (in: cyanobacteria)]|uniref:glycosyltransferase n=1 Tax=unclassified Nodularia (in: cyanobacteria) TaxID=2656917 RepID=UPI00187E5046|nr:MULTISPECIES: glycosyltransferase family 2 protein [unclassified Nodularia (in: cyanobacteria)]MBE9201830.1 glycosyltransferase family 2 protein [Nodularia sp. LEGE 06071]MCC2693261.1 glycosyltransferase family 2 protein [Nodularia sp. LEGE 04288]